MGLYVKVCEYEKTIAEFALPRASCVALKQALDKAISEEDQCTS